MVVLVCKENAQDLELISFMLESRFQARILRAQGFQEAIEHLLEDSFVDLIVCDYTKDNMKLFKFMLSLGEPIPLILFRASEAADPKGLPDLRVLAYVESEQKLEQLEGAIRDAIKGRRLLAASAIHEDYCRIKTPLLLKTVPLCADVYIRLSSIKFVKIFSKGDVFDQKDLDRIQNKKNVEYLFIKSNETQAFIEKFQRDLSKVVEESMALKSPNMEVMTVSIQDSVNQLVQKLGFTESVQNIVNQNVKLTMQSFQMNPSNQHYLRFLAENKEKYTSVHSVILSRIACSLAIKMSWASPATLSKLAVAAMIHDVTLQNDRLAAVHTLEELKVQAAEFTPEELEAYRNHPVKVSELVRDCRNFPANIDAMLLEHHERPDGTGFPQGLMALQISPLGCILILAHDIVDSILIANKDVTIEDFVTRNKEKYNHGHFKLIFQALATGIPYRPGWLTDTENS